MTFESVISDLTQRWQIWQNRCDLGCWRKPRVLNRF